MKALNIFDATGNAATGWNHTNKLTDVAISNLKDKAARSTHALNAVPSPFARMHIFETAFKLVTRDAREKQDNASRVYMEIVSDCLDAIELVFNAAYHESQGDTLEFVNWMPSDLNRLSSGTRGQQVYRKTLGLYLDQDFSDSTRPLSIVQYRGLAIAGSSPFSILFTSPNLDKTQGRFRSDRYEQQFDLINPATGVPYFKKQVPFAKRSPDFKSYVYAFFRDYPALKQDMRHFWDYLDSEGISTEDKKRPVLLRAVNCRNGGQFQAGGVPIQVNADERAQEIFADHLVRVAYRLNDAYFQAPGFTGDNSERDFDFLLPLRESFLKQADLRMLGQYVSYEVRGSDCVKVRYNDGRLDKHKLFYTSGGGKSDGRLIDTGRDLGYSFTLGLFPAYRILTTDRKPHPAYNDYYKVALAIDAGQHALFKTERFQLAFFKKTADALEEISEDGAGFNAQRFVRRAFEDPSMLASVFYQVNNTTFDLIRLTLPPGPDGKPVTGLAVPKWVEKDLGSKQIDFSVDFGTTNTFIAYTDDVTHSSVPRAFDITLKDQQMVMLQQLETPRAGRTLTSMLTKGSATGSLVGHIMYNEFIPPLLLSEEPDSPFRMPYRTAIFEKNNVRSFKLFDDINIHFAYQKTLIDANDTASSKVVSNLKWDITDKTVSGARERVDAYIRQLCLMFRHKILMNDGDPGRTSLSWFIPQSLSQAARTAYQELWEHNVRAVLKSQQPPRMVLEAEAPYYFFKRTGQVISSHSVLSVDIGGGSTDAMLFVNDIPRIGTSFNFAGNALWSNGYNRLNDHERNNGFYRSLNEKLAGEIESSDDNIRFSIREYDNRPTDEVINFWLANSDKLKVLDHLKDPQFRIVYLVHFTAIIYHLGQLLKANSYSAPNSIIFSGNGSKYIDFIGDDKMLGKISGYIMEKVFQGETPAPRIILPPENRKEATCFGGIFKTGELEFSTLSYLGTELSFKGAGSSVTYEQVAGQLAEIKASVRSNIKDMFRLLEGLNDVIPFRGSLNIDLNISTLTNYMDSRLDDYFDQGYEIRTEKIAYGEKVSDSLFFYPLLGVIFDLGKIREEEIGDFAPKKSYYASEPAEEHIFSSRALTDTKMYNSIYQVDIPVGNPNEATFELIKEKAVYQRAYSGKEHLIKPVCQPVNLPPSADINIRMLNKGKLRKDGNSWIVTEKLKIEYL